MNDVNQGLFKKTGYLKNISTTSTNNHYLQTEDVLCNPQNPVNPDSEPGVRINFQISKLYSVDIPLWQGRMAFALP